MSDQLEVLHTATEFALSELAARNVDELLKQQYWLKGRCEAPSRNLRPNFWASPGFLLGSLRLMT